MSERQTRGTALRQLRSVVVRKSDNGYRFTAIASTDGTATDGLAIATDAWDTSRYDAIGRPVFWNHEYDLPVGRAARVWTDERGLMVDIELDMDDETGKAQGLARRIRAGLVNALSVGFHVVERSGAQVAKAILHEVSIVSMPADAGALIVARSDYARRAGPPLDTRLRALPPADLARLHAALCPPAWRLRHQLTTMPPRARDTFLRGLSESELAAIRDTLPAA